MESSDSGENSSDFACTCKACAFSPARTNRPLSEVSPQGFVPSYGRAFCLTVSPRRDEPGSRAGSSLCLYDVQKSIDTTASERSISPLVQHRQTRTQSSSSSIDEYSSDSTFGQDYSFVPRQKSLLDLPSKNYAEQTEKSRVGKINSNRFQQNGTEKYSNEPVKFINVWFGSLIEPNLRDSSLQPNHHYEDFVDSGWNNKFLDTRRHVPPPKVRASRCLVYCCRLIY